jgi:hypothetical protein
MSKNDFLQDTEEVLSKWRKYFLHVQVLVKALRNTRNCVGPIILRHGSMYVYIHWQNQGAAGAVPLPNPHHSEIVLIPCKKFN